MKTEREKKFCDPRRAIRKLTQEGFLVKIAPGLHAYERKAVRL